MKKQIFIILFAITLMIANAASGWCGAMYYARAADNRGEHIDGLLGDDPLWGRFWENPDLSPAQGRHLIRARDAAREILAQLEPSLDYGLIHADLVPENVLLHNGGAQLIDFDDGGFGFRLFDLATAVNRLSREENSDTLIQAVLDGYLSERNIDLSPLPVFRAVRSFTYLAWITPRLHEADAHERCRRYSATALTWAGRVLNDCQFHD